MKASAYFEKEIEESEICKILSSCLQMFRRFTSRHLTSFSNKHNISSWIWSLSFTSIIVHEDWTQERRHWGCNDTLEEWEFENESCANLWRANCWSSATKRIFETIDFIYVSLVVVVIASSLHVVALLLIIDIRFQITQLLRVVQSKTLIYESYLRHNFMTHDVLLSIFDFVNKCSVMRNSQHDNIFWWRDLF